MMQVALVGFALGIVLLLGFIAIWMWAKERINRWAERLFHGTNTRLYEHELTLSSIERSQERLLSTLERLDEKLSRQNTSINELRGAISSARTSA